MTRILLTGKVGLVGYERERGLQGLGAIIAPGRCQKDLANGAQVRDVIDPIRPNLIINFAPHTAADKAGGKAGIDDAIQYQGPSRNGEQYRLHPRFFQAV